MSFDRGILDISTLRRDRNKEKELQSDNDKLKAMLIDHHMENASLLRRSNFFLALVGAQAIAKLLGEPDKVDAGQPYILRLDKQWVAAMFRREINIGEDETALIIQVGVQAKAEGEASVPSEGAGGQPQPDGDSIGNDRSDVPADGAGGDEHPSDVEPQLSVLTSAPSGEAAGAGEERPGDAGVVGSSAEGNDSR
jgi:hypothetical protein